MNQKYLPWLLVLLSTLYIFTLIYFYSQINILRQQLPAVVPTVVPTISILPTTTIVPTIKATSTLTPTQTPKPTTVINLSYKLPAGWSEVKLRDSSFSVGYDPQDMNITQNSIQGLNIRYNSTKYSYADFIAQEKTYDGGSRHTFIYNIIGGNVAQDKLPGYHEKEYKIGGITCLFLIGIQPSQSLPTWGMCPLSSTKAVLLNLSTRDDVSIEKLLRTIKFTSTATASVTYQNQNYHFSFQYPGVYTIQDTGGGAKTSDGNTVLATFITSDQKTLEVLLDSNSFNLNNIKRYAATGQEEIPPTKLVENSYAAFYYYGPGGGGVCYPDQFFTEITGQILRLRFSGCDGDKTPSDTTKTIEHQILSSFRFI